MGNDWGCVDSVVDWGMMHSMMDRGMMHSMVDRGMMHWGVHSMMNRGVYSVVDRSVDSVVEGHGVSQVVGGVVSQDSAVMPVVDNVGRDVSGGGGLGQSNQGQHRRKSLKIVKIIFLSLEYFAITSKSRQTHFVHTLYLHFCDVAVK